MSVTDAIAAIVWASFQFQRATILGLRDVQDRVRARRVRALELLRLVSGDLAAAQASLTSAIEAEVA